MNKHLTMATGSGGGAPTKPTREKQPVTPAKQPSRSK